MNNNKIKIDKLINFMNNTDKILNSKDSETIKKMLNKILNRVIELDENINGLDSFILENNSDNNLEMLSIRFEDFIHLGLNLQQEMIKYFIYNSVNKTYLLLLLDAYNCKKTDNLKDEIMGVFKEFQSEIIENCKYTNIINFMDHLGYENIDSDTIEDVQFQFNIVINTLLKLEYLAERKKEDEIPF